MQSFFTPIRNLVAEQHISFQNVLPFALLRLLEIQTAQAEVSLTDSQSTHEQLRFFQKERTFRYLTDLAVRFYFEQSALPLHYRVSFPIRLAGTSDELLSEPIQFFLSELKRLQVPYTSVKLEPETRLASDTQPPEKGWLMERFAAGDTWTTLEVLDRFPGFLDRAEWARVTGVSLALQGRTERAERFLEAWSIFGSPSDRVWSHYSIAMLYARHHGMRKRSLATAERHLKLAWNILSQETEDTVGIRFNRAFNRNGLALLLFRKGDIEGAIDLLHYGLGLFPNEADHLKLHKSVLLYNLAQCQIAKSDLQSAADSFYKLIQIDPHYAENRIEYAKVLMDLEEDGLALVEVSKAIQLDASIAAAWNLKGVILSQDPEKSNAALELMKRSYLLSPQDPQITLDYAEGLLAHQQSEQARKVLGESEDNVWKNADSDQKENRMVLLAESHLQDHALDRAHFVLKDALLLCPESTHLKENLDYVQSLA